MLVGVLSGLTGCNDTSSNPSESPSGSPTATATPAPSETPDPSPDASASATPVSPVISETGIGAAVLGMTLADLKQALPNAEFTVESPFIVDFDAIAVSQDGEVQFYILYLAGETFTDSDVVQGLMTKNATYKTAEGVGAGTRLSEAETAYGQVTLAYNIDNEGREFARFEQQPSTNISFGTGNGNTETAGIYPSPTSDFNETQDYRDEATIESVWVVCLSEGCGGPP